MTPILHLSLMPAVWGCPICYSIINRHKGHISVASQLGAGTVATVYLPAQVKPRSTPQKSQRAAEHRMTGHISW